MKHQIYALRRNDGLIKIGTTANLPVRLRALSTSHGPLEVVRLLNGDRKREQELHHAFRTFREFGEWFRADVESLVLALPDVPEVLSTKARIKSDWEADERRLAKEAQAKANDLVSRRKARSNTTRTEAVAEISAEQGIPENFLLHVLKGRALSISAHGFKVIGEAYVAEMKAHIVELEHEMAALDQGKELR